MYISEPNWKQFTKKITILLIPAEGVKVENLKSLESVDVHQRTHGLAVLPSFSGN